MRQMMPQSARSVWILALLLLPAVAVAETFTLTLDNGNTFLSRYQPKVSPDESKVLLTQGNIFHGELSLEQLLFLRPAAGWAKYRTPIRKLWLCSSGAHPGGGLMGAPGELAARTLLRSGEV